MQINALQSLGRVRLRTLVAGGSTGCSMQRSPVQILWLPALSRTGNVSVCHSKLARVQLLQ